MITIENKATQLDDLLDNMAEALQLLTKFSVRVKFTVLSAFKPFEKCYKIFSFLDYDS